MTTAQDTKTLVIGSPAFAPGEVIPVAYICEGENINPPLTIENIPLGTKSLALIIDDPDADGRTFDHWLVWNIRPREMILENTVPGVEGRNGFAKSKYLGPCPPTGTHRYFFKVFALDALLNVRAGADKQQLEQAMKQHILAKGEMIGLYRKSKAKNE